MMVRKPQTNAWQKWERPGTLFAILAGILLLVAIIYIIMLLVQGKFSPYAYASDASLAALMTSLSTAKILFAAGLWLFVILVLLRWPKFDAAGWLFLLFGVGLYFGARHLLVMLAPAIDLAAFDSPGVLFLSFLQSHAGGLAAIGFIRVVIGLVLKRAVTPTASIATTRSKEVSRSLMRQCWELSFCRDELRERCLCFRQKIPCWRKQSGCYCGGEVSHMLATSLAASRFDASSIPMDRATPNPIRPIGSPLSSRSTKQLKKPCIECPIYQEHQRYKFRIFAWLVYPVAIIAVWSIAEAIRIYWEDLDLWLADKFNTVSLLPTPTGAGIKDYAGTLDLSYVVIVIIGLILATILLKISEYLILKRGL